MMMVTSYQVASWEFIDSSGLNVKQSQRFFFCPCPWVFPVQEHNKLPILSPTDLTRVLYLGQKQNHAKMLKEMKERGECEKCIRKENPLEFAFQWIIYDGENQSCWGFFPNLWNNFSVDFQHSSENWWQKCWVISV